MDDSNDDGGLLNVSLSKESSNDGGPTGDQDGQDENNEAEILFKLDGLNLFVHFTHSSNIFLKLIIILFKF